MTTLFDLPPCAATADPRTSHLSAAEVTASGQREGQAREVADMVKRHPGRTSRELAKACDVDRHMVAKRLPDAERLSLVRRGAARACAESGRMALTWWEA